MQSNNKIKILFAGAELAPLVKVGGLGDVIGSLPQALNKIGANVSAIIPFYAAIDKKIKVKLAAKNLAIEIEGKKNKFSVYQTVLPGKVTVYLVKHKIFNKPEIYFGKRQYFGQRVYSRSITDIERFVFFSKAVVETVKQLPLKVDLIHCHDWHTALIPTFIDEYSLHDEQFKNIKTLFTIHNLANQGISGLDIVDYASLDQNLTPALMEDYYDQDNDKVDLMKIGILSADFVSTVSPTYAKEILTKPYGEGLDDYLKRRRKHLAGIINGIDINFFNPARDKFIRKKFTVSSVGKNKPLNKQALQKISKLPIADVPIFSVVSRLVQQKGLGILSLALDKILTDHDIQVIILGTGQAEYENVFRQLAKKYPHKVRAFIKFDLKLAQKIYAGSDWFLMPSLFEPCGLGQMIAMRYGCLPIVRSTGGLKDTVKNNKTGLVFSNYKAASLIKMLNKAIVLYQKQGKIKSMVIKAMQQDFSWHHSARAYYQLYQKITRS